jgi:murein hydrolase activator
MNKLVFIFLLILCLNAQDNLNETNSRIQRLKEEIADLEVKKSELDSKKDDVLYDLKSSYHLILIAKKNKELSEKTLNSLRLSIKQKENKEKQLISSIKVTKKSYEQRLVDSYKVPPKSWFELLTESSSVDEFIRMMKYKEYIDKAERNLLEQLKSDQDELKAIIESLKKSELLKKTAAEEFKKAVVNLTSAENKLKNKLKSINNNKSQLLSVIQKREKERTNLEKKREELIRREKERLRQSGKSEVEISVEFKRLAKDFSKNKGRFSWPVQGKIIKPFGKVKIPQLKIYEQSTGIEIKSEKGNNVRSIFSGIVVEAEFDSHGNTVIVSHGGGYFTVYSFLEDILVKKEQAIVSGEVIGTVGSTGTINGVSRLHFELWSEASALNPVKWLK